jgi:hypothetical protein
MQQPESEKFRGSVISMKRFPKHPVALQENGFTPKQVNAAEAVRRVTITN